MSTPPDTLRRSERIPGWLAWLGFVALCVGAGFASSLAGNMGLYQELARPSWSPPAAVFAPAWTTLYVLTGTAAYLVWRRTTRERRRTAMVAFGIQVVLNAAWTPVFFGLEQFLAALVLIIAIWLSVVAMTVVFARRVPLAGALVVPLVLWVSFATALNASIWWLNRGG